MAELFIDLESVAEGTLQQRIYRAVLAGIHHGQLRAGTRIPSSRELAIQLGVSRNTVMLAYERLESEGYVETKKTGGTFIAETIPDPCLRVGSRMQVACEDIAEAQPRRPVRFTGQRPSTASKNEAPPIDFWYGNCNKDCFPTESWRKLLLDRLPRAAANIAQYVPPAGLVELRRAIADHLGEARGIKPAWERVIITAGAQEAFELVAKLFISHGTRVAVESPCYQGAAYAFRSHGAELVSIPVDRHGMNVSALTDVPDVTLASVMPSHQFPTGVTLSLERRMRLLQWAWRTGAYIVEDDYDSDFRYDGPPLPALASLDEDRDTVIYIGTFSKSLGPGVGIGFLLVPTSLIEVTTVAKYLTSHGQSWLQQIVLADFLSSGGYRRHLRRLRYSRRQARDCLVNALTSAFGNVRLTGTQAGMHVLWWLPDEFSRASVVAARARRLGVGLYPPSAANAMVSDPAYDSNTILLGYSALSVPDIEEGVALIAKSLT